MHDLVKLFEEDWWLLILFGPPVAEWVADRFDSGFLAMAKRRRRKVAHREKLREMELEVKRRELEAKHPKPIEPICGCTHNVSFHDRAANICKKNIGTLKNPFQCECAGYTGPEPLSQIYADPLM